MPLSMSVNELKKPLAQYHDMVVLWSLRILLDLKGYTRMDIEYGLYGHERALSALGLDKLIDKYDDEKELTKKEFRRILMRHGEKYAARDIQLANPLQRNIDKLGELIGLSDIEKQLLSFGILLHSTQDLEAICNILGSTSSHSAVNTLAVILDIDPALVRQSLAADGLLNRTGLLRLRREDSVTLDYQLTVLDEISDVLLDEESQDIMESLKRFFMPGRQAKLQSSDYEHITKDYELIKGYLRAACKKRIAGINILIYGAPGTGKTEMVRTLAHDLGFGLYEVTTTDSDNDIIMYQGRLDAYQLCQQVLKRKSNTLILFDEIEDVFIRDGSMERFGIRTSVDSKKGWFNHLLEENHIPSIWISNVISHIDEAIIRRFDYILELKTPPRKIRANIIKKYTEPLGVSDAWVEKVSHNEELAPALISRGVRVVKTLGYRNQQRVEATLERVISNTMNAMGYDKNLSQHSALPITYRLDTLNPDYDLYALEEGLREYGQGRFCIYGPPGTGKSEFARYIAEVLDKSLIVKRASDLLDPYVGMTEKMLKGMFEQAIEEEAVLLLDEADSFLQDRSRARQTWEISQVNELLTQMERFEGIFICSTNLMDNLDKASLRRFDLKIKFDYLQQEQAWILFEQVMMDANIILDTPAIWKKRLFQLIGLTPGDFATVVRQNRYNKKGLDPALFLAGLQKELTFKDDNSLKKIGFVASP